MDISARRKKTSKVIISDKLSDLYPHNLNLYIVSPTHKVHLSEFEDIALERLQLFRIIEQGNLKGHRIYSDTWRNCIIEDLLKAGLKKFHRLASSHDGSSSLPLDYEARRVDHISHFILRLAYCRSENLRRWFLNRELEWFSLKFNSLSHQSKLEFLKINNISYTSITIDEKNSIKNELSLCSNDFNSDRIDTETFFKVPFTDVCPLVRKRKVFLKKGWAYITVVDLVVCIQSKFRAILNEGLNIYYRRLPAFDDDRINGLLNNLHNIHTGNTYTVNTENKNSISIESLDYHAKNNFPLCMKNLHDVFKTKHHLKHQERLHYGLFLKGIGLIYEDALKYWTDELRKGLVDERKIDKEFTYMVKHHYGQAGRMTNYTPYSCLKIIMSSAGPDDHHGCPFKHWDIILLKNKMFENGCTAENFEDIKQLVTNGHYQLACGKYFEYTKGKPPTNSINHPNFYFDQSVNLFNEKEKELGKKK